MAVAEGGNIGGFSGDAAGRFGKDVGDAALAVPRTPGQTRSVTIHVDATHPLIDGAWMLGNTNDGFSGPTGFDAYNITGRPKRSTCRGYDAGSEKNNEKKGFLGALGGGNDRDPENGVITFHTGIRGDADAPKAWNWTPPSRRARHDHDHGAVDLNARGSPATQRRSEGRPQDRRSLQDRAARTRRWRRSQCP